MKPACSALCASLALAACVPTMEMREGEEKERLVQLVRQFCAAERSEDPADTAALFTDEMQALLQRRDALGLGPKFLASADPKAGCEPGRAWYLGGSRMFAEVRLAGRSDRLDLWRSAAPRIGNVLYGRQRRANGRKVKSLEQALKADLGLLPGTVPPPPPPPDLACFSPSFHFAFVGTDTSVYRQGASVRVTPMADRSPAGTVELPLRCTSGWTVEGPATLSADRTTVAIAPDAPVGSVVSIGFRHGEKPVALRFRVVGRDEIVLTGRYGERSLEGCSAHSPVRELEFQPENRFSVTFMPFETYRDYWGSYAFDPATKQLRLKVEGGNFVPPNLDVEGQAELADGRLRLKGMFLGSRDGPPQSGCTYVF